MEVRRVTHDLLAEPDGWMVTACEEPQLVAPVVITPDLEHATDSGDRPALWMPPPCEVQLQIPPDAQATHLVLFAGADLSVARLLARAPAGATGSASLDILFEVERNGVSVFAETIRTHPKRARDAAREDRPMHFWHPASGTDDGRLPVRAGDRIVLRTLLAPGQVPPAKGPRGAGDALKVGFGPLLLEQTRTQPRTRADDEHPNILLIVMDTQRLDRTDLGPGGRTGLTPRLAELGRRGTVFENARASSSWTWPSTASILTGRLSADHGVKSYQACTLSHGLETLAEVLQDTGYVTGAFSANPLISVARQFDQGFETFRSVSEFQRGDRLLPDLFTWLEEHAQDRFFLYVHMADPHSPHEPLPQDLERICGTREAPFAPRMIETLATLLRAGARPAVDGPNGADSQADPSPLVSSDQARWLDSVYDASVATGDRWVGAILDHLGALGLEANTGIAFTSDHGEELLDHGLLEHAHSLYDELIRVPMVLAGPGLAAGRRVSAPVSNRHLATTLAHLAGADGRLGGEGLDLLQTEGLGGPVFFDTHKGWWNGREFLPIHGVIDGDFVLHWAPTGLAWEAPKGTDPGDGMARLYHRGDDPLQERDLSAERPRVLERLRALIQRRLATDHRRAAARGARPGRAGASTMEMLRAVGYAGEEEDR